MPAYPYAKRKMIIFMFAYPYAEQNLTIFMPAYPYAEQNLIIFTSAYPYAERKTASGHRAARLFLQPLVFPNQYSFYLREIKLEREKIDERVIAPPEKILWL